MVKGLSSGPTHPQGHHFPPKSQFFSPSDTNFPSFLFYFPRLAHKGPRLEKQVAKSRGEQLARGLGPLAPTELQEGKLGVGCAKLWKGKMYRGQAESLCCGVQVRNQQDTPQVQGNVAF